MGVCNNGIDVLRHFFIKNAKALAISLTISIAALGAWYYEVSYQQNSAQTMSIKYQAISSAIQVGKLEMLESLKKFTKENKNTYGALAALNLAKLYVDNNQLDKAIILLQNGLQDTNESNLQAVIGLRLARIQLELNQVDAALKTLDHINVKGDGWMAIVDDVRGEVLLGKGDKQGAREAWMTGLRSDTSFVLKQIMQMKISNLS